MSDADAIAALVLEYAARIDAGDLDGLAALFAGARWRSSARPDGVRGRAAVRRLYDDVVLYEGRPRHRQRPSRALLARLDAGPLVLALIQMLWDRSDPNGYAHHITSDPLPNTPPHEVLLHEAFGDHQVANVSTEIEARTIGASIHQPALAPGRHSDVNPYFGIPAIPSYPFDGSALVVWDSGAATPPITNTPPTVGADPHSDPRNSPLARQQKSEFLKAGGAVVDVCSGAPCTAP